MADRRITLSLSAIKSAERELERAKRGAAEELAIYLCEMNAQQNELARLTGYDATYISKIVNGYVVPSAAFIEKCRAVLPAREG